MSAPNDVITWLMSGHPTGESPSDRAVLNGLNFRMIGISRCLFRWTMYRQTGSYFLFYSIISVITSQLANPSVKMKTKFYIF